MNLDIRSPIGILFLLFGVLLAGYGLLHPYESRDGFNANIAWGVVMSAFGGVMLWMARRSK